MSTWAARLAMSSTPPRSGAPGGEAKTPVSGNSHTPSEASASSFFSCYAPASTEDTPWLSKREPFRNELRQMAVQHNRDLGKIPMLRLPMDAWETISFFLSFTELLQLAGTCHALWDAILHRDSIWEQQLGFWHRDIMDLRGGALLLTVFVFGPKCTGYERFKRQRRLYALDAHREWHFRELESLEDRATGFFTVPLHLGKENTESDAAAPIALELSQTTLGSTPRIPGSPPRVRMPAVGQPFVGAEDSSQRLRIWRPIRRGEDPTSDGFGNALMPLNERESGREKAGGGWSRHALDAPTSLEEEEAMLSYALACSEAEMSGLSPPPPPFIWTSSKNKSNRCDASKESLRRSYSGLAHDLSLGNSFAGGGGGRGGEIHYLKPSEIMTLIDLINSGTPVQSLIPLIEVTTREDELVLLALTETLKGAQRRRLHLGNHHRALANNGQTTRRRLGPTSLRRPRPPAAASSSFSPSPISTSPLAPFPPVSSPSWEDSTSPSPVLPPPPVNSMLRGFTGVLLEVYRREMYRFCEEFLGSSQRLDDFILFDAANSSWWRGGGGEGAASLGFATGTRFFLAPELCRGGRVGLVVVDAVRMLIVVEDEKMARDDPAWMQGYARVDRGGRLVMPGSGYNAQYYERSELRPL
ncbi:unnamed protein product [Phytomonas sp. EM1]|nr:unnamed protein product [Phytomonas sp. EM1]|eukprot:CCW63122.1 unnamed protein product [Phytomonas sp. isolate EM1]